MKEMQTLTFPGGETYEVVDAKARAGVAGNAQGIDANAEAIAANVQAVATLSEEIAKLPQGGGAAIIDVTELPTDDINEDVFYRLLTGTFYFNGTPRSDWTCCVVESLPQEGEPVMTDMVHVLLYYAVDTGNVSGYIPSALSGAVGVPAGWYPVEALAQAFNLACGGIIWDDSEDPIDGTNRLLLAYHLYQYKQEWYDLSEKVGWRGAAVGSEVFNSLRNVASGNYSHAEGGGTTASGDCSHAEGERTSVTSNSRGGHAEGLSTIAMAWASHAEGSYTISGGYAQHVEGEYNIPDSDGTGDIRSKYLHIAGNGDGDSYRSNAHALDWSGNAYYAGDVYVNGDGENDFAGMKKVATEEYVGAQGNTKLSLPQEGGVINHGTAGQFAVSDGNGGITWKTLVKAEEVSY